ncbi:hypothetical protein BGW38_002395, partial [Lunasporangiospora selenospora]
AARGDSCELASAASGSFKECSINKRDATQPQILPASTHSTIDPDDDETIDRIK